MRKLCPNLDREDGLETVLEVPIPEEMFSSPSKHSGVPSWQSMKFWMRSQLDRSAAAPASMTARLGGRNAELQILLGVAGAPLVPFPVRQDQKSPNQNIKDHPIESSMAKYIVQQYRAAVGGERALDGIDSVYAMGRVKMGTAEFCGGDAGKEMKPKSSRRRGGAAGEVGSFVLWQKRPDLWSLELVLSGCKISAGSDGHVAWRQTPWHLPHASRGPPRPLRRSLQGLDPRSTANMFSNSVCVGEKTIKEEECFVLKLEADQTALRARSSKNVEMIRHTVWGYFSQRTGLLVQLEDSHLLGIKSNNHSRVYWETTMESLIQEYKTIDGVNIAHSGRTVVSLVRFGEGSSRTRMEEEWSIEEVDFNIKGLSKECFMAPAELKRDDEEEEEGFCADAVVVAGNGTGRIPNFRGHHVIGGAVGKVGGSKVVAVSDESSAEETDSEEDDRL